MYPTWTCQSSTQYYLRSMCAFHVPCSANLHGEFHTILLSRHFDMQIVIPLSAWFYNFLLHFMLAAATQTYIHPNSSSTTLENHFTLFSWKMPSLTHCSHLVQIKMKTISYQHNTKKSHNKKSPKEVSNLVICFFHGLVMDL